MPSQWLYTVELKQGHSPPLAIKRALCQWELNVPAQQVHDTLHFWPSRKFGNLAAATPADAARQPAAASGNDQEAASPQPAAAVEEQGKGAPEQGSGSGASPPLAAARGSVERAAARRPPSGAVSMDVGLPLLAAAAAQQRLSASWPAPADGDGGGADTAAAPPSLPSGRSHSASQKATGGAWGNAAPLPASASTGLLSPSAQQLTPRPSAALPPRPATATGGAAAPGVSTSAGSPPRLAFSQPGTSPEPKQQQQQQQQQPHLAPRAGEGQGGRPRAVSDVGGLGTRDSLHSHLTAAHAPMLQQLVISSDGGRVVLSPGGGGGGSAMLLGSPGATPFYDPGSVAAVLGAAAGSPVDAEGRGWRGGAGGVMPVVAAAGAGVQPCVWQVDASGALVPAQHVSAPSVSAPLGGVLWLSESSASAATTVLPSVAFSSPALSLQQQQPQQLVLLPTGALVVADGAHAVHAAGGGELRAAGGQVAMQVVAEPQPVHLQSPAGQGVAHRVSGAAAAPAAAALAPPAGAALAAAGSIGGAMDALPPRSSTAGAAGASSVVPGQAGGMTLSAAQVSKIAHASAARLWRPRTPPRLTLPWRLAPPEVRRCPPAACCCQRQQRRRPTALRSPWRTASLRGPSPRRVARRERAPSSWCCPTSSSSSCCRRCWRSRASTWCCEAQRGAGKGALAFQRGSAGGWRRSPCC